MNERAETALTLLQRIINENPKAKPSTIRARFLRAGRSRSEARHLR